MLRGLLLLRHVAFALVAALVAAADEHTAHPSCAYVDTTSSHAWPAAAQPAAWTMVLNLPPRFKTLGNPFGLVNVSMPATAPSMRAATVVGGSSYVIAPDQRSVAVHLAAHASTLKVHLDGHAFEIMGEGEWDIANDRVGFSCAGLTVPPLQGACEALGVDIDVENVWATGYIAHLKISSWQLGAVINMQLPHGQTRGVYVEKVEVNGATEERGWHHDAKLAFAQATGELTVTLDDAVVPGSKGAGGAGAALRRLETDAEPAAEHVRDTEHGLQGASQWPRTPHLAPAGTAAAAAAAAESAKTLDEMMAAKPPKTLEQILMEGSSAEPAETMPSISAETPGAAAPEGAAIPTKSLDEILRTGPEQSVGVTITLTVQTSKQPTLAPHVASCEHVRFPPGPPSPAPPPPPPPNPRGVPSPSPLPPPNPPPPCETKTDVVASLAACPFALHFEQTATHHTKFNVLLHLTPPAGMAVPPSTEIVMSFEAPVVLHKVYHAVRLAMNTLTRTLTLTSTRCITPRASL